MSESCVFCRIIAGEIPAHIVHDDEKTVVFLDSGPLFPGHCLVCPKKHYDTMYDVPKSMLEPLFSKAQLVGQAIEQALGAEGTFVAINNKVSQSVPHLHVHVIPRRRKDGMKGFFWPRRPYRDDNEAAETAATLRTAMASLTE
jgi:histidine triad (HIT) family protein